MLLAIFSIIAGLALLIWSTERFIEGVAATLRYFGMASLLIGVIVVGFGTSMPEIVVSVISATEENASVALGNAYGSNIALIQYLTTVFGPLSEQSNVLRKELRVLTSYNLQAVWQIWDGTISRLDATVFLTLFIILVGWSIWQGIRNPTDASNRLIEVYEITYGFSGHL